MTAIADEPTLILTDTACLDRWIASRDDAAFETLARRHVDLVYAAAKRQMNGDTAAAEDVTQATFLVLAQRSTAARRASSLAAWLHLVTRYASANARRQARRRRKHEAAAATLRSEAAMPEEVIEPDALLPLLDEAIASLGAKDRVAIVERYLKGRDVSAVATTVGTTAEAAQKRIERAVIKLRRHLVTRLGDAASPAAVVAALSAPIASAPAHVLNAFGPAALSMSPGPASLAKNMLTMMLTTKLKVIALAIAPLLLLGGAATVVAFTRSPQVVAPTNRATTPADIPNAKPLTAALPSGVIVSLRGLSRPFATGEPSWWSADGTALPAAHAPIDWRDARTLNGATGEDVAKLERYVRDFDRANATQAVEFAIDVTGAGDADAIASVQVAEVPDASAYPAAAPDDERYRHGPQRMAWIGRMPVTISSATLRVRVESGAAQEVGNVGGGVDATIVVGEGTVRLSHSHDAANGAAFDLDVSPDVAANYRLRVVAIDQTGHIHKTAAVEGDDLARRVTIQGVPLASLGRIVLRGVPLRTIEFRDVSLRPDLHSKPSVVVLDGPSLSLDRSTPRAAARALLRAIEVDDVETLGKLVLRDDEPQRRLFQAGIIDAAASRGAAAQAARARFGENGATLFTQDESANITRVLTLPDALIRIAGNRAIVPIADGGPPTPFVRVGDAWLADMAEYSRLCGLSVDEDVALSRKTNTVYDAIRTRVDRGDFVDWQELMTAYHAALAAQ